MVPQTYATEAKALLEDIAELVAGDAEDLTEDDID